MAEPRSTPVVSDDAVACVCLTVLIITFLAGGIALVASGHDMGYTLIGAGFVGTYLFLF